MWALPTLTAVNGYQWRIPAPEGAQWDGSTTLVSWETGKPESWGMSCTASLAPTATVIRTVEVRVKWTWV